MIRALRKSRLRYTFATIRTKRSRRVRGMIPMDRVIVKRYTYCGGRRGDFNEWADLDVILNRVTEV